MNATLDPSNPSTHQTASPAYQAFRILHIGCVAAPIIAGVDKFFHVLVNWDQYLPASVARVSPIGAHNLMLVVGVIKLVASIGVAWKPRMFAYVVSACLSLIMVNMLFIPA